MKIKKKKISPRLFVLATLAAVLLFGGVGYAVWKLNSSDTIPGPTKEEKATGETIKENSIKADNNGNPSGDGSDPLPEPTPSDNGGKPVVGMDITSVNQDESTLKIRTIIKTVSSTGACQLSMTHSSGSKYNSSVAVQPLSSSTTCKGFDIPLTSLKSGSWKVTVSFENDSVQSQTTREISVQ